MFSTAVPKETDAATFPAATSQIRAVLSAPTVSSFAPSGLHAAWRAAAAAGGGRGSRCSGVKKGISA